jgi:hypothetical protein
VNTVRGFLRVCLGEREIKFFQVFAHQNRSKTIDNYRKMGKKNAPFLSIGVEAEGAPKKRKVTFYFFFFFFFFFLFSLFFFPEEKYEFGSTKQ